MSGFLDTNVIVRYLIGDAPEMAERARRIIEEEDELLLTDATVAEVGHVPTRVYRLPREQVVDHLIGLVRRRNITMFSLGDSLAIEALLLCRPSTRVSFADAMLWAVTRTSARAGEQPVVYTFDARFPSDGIDVRSVLA